MESNSGSSDVQKNWEEWEEWEEHEMDAKSTDGQSADELEEKCNLLQTSNNSFVLWLTWRYFFCAVAVGQEEEDEKKDIAGNEDENVNKPPEEAADPIDPLDEMKRNLMKRFDDLYKSQGHSWHECYNSSNCLIFSLYFEQFRSKLALVQMNAAIE